jgi:hypothetical protein
MTQATSLILTSTITGLARDSTTGIVQNGDVVGVSYLSPKKKNQNSEGEGRKRHSRECEREHVAAIELKRNVTATEQ